MSKGLKITQKQLAILCVAVLIISIIPIIVISFYNHPSYDDFNFSLPVKQAVDSNGNLFSVLSAALGRVKQAYFDWQGTYSAIFLFTLQPAVFGEGFYAVSTFILLGSLIFSVSLFLKRLLHDCMRVTKSNTVILISLCLFTCIHCAPSPVEAFFWYNGSIFYTFFFSLMLLLLSALIKEYFLLKSRPVKSAVAVLRFSLLIILSLIIGGGNYITALLTAVLLFALSVYVVLCRRQIPTSKRIFMYAIFLFFMLGFAVSILAPGNDVRQAYFTDRPGAFMSIIFAYSNAINFILGWLGKPVVFFAVILLLPILYHTAAGLNFSYPLPALAPIAAITLIAVQFTPNSYAQNGMGPGRAHNIIFYSFVLLLAATVFYICGWLSRNLFSKKETESAKSRFLQVQPLYITAVSVLATAVLLSAKADTKKLTGVSALLSIKSGEASSYSAEVDDRMEILNNPQIRNAVLKPIKNRPYVLFWSDLQNDTEAKYYKQYFEKDSVRLE